MVMVSPRTVMMSSAARYCPRTLRLMTCHFLPIVRLPFLLSSTVCCNPGRGNHTGSLYTNLHSRAPGVAKSGPDVDQLVGVGSHAVRPHNWPGRVAAAVVVASLAWQHQLLLACDTSIHWSINSWIHCWVSDTSHYLKSTLRIVAKLYLNYLSQGLVRITGGVYSVRCNLKSCSQTHPS